MQQSASIRNWISPSLIVPGSKAETFAKQIVASIDVLTPQQLGIPTEDDDDFDTYYLIDRNLQVQNQNYHFLVSCHHFLIRLLMSWWMRRAPQLVIPFYY